MERLRKRKLSAVPGAGAAVRIGRPADEIVQAGGKGRSHLIVIGTHGHSGVVHLLLGSVAERVVRRASCPVLVVPARSAAGKR
jgi:nucleotide-binding universal stress UspA family protein